MFLILAHFTLFGLIAGPLFLFGIVKPAHGGSGQSAGIALTILGLLLAPFFLWAILTLVLGRKLPITFHNDYMDVIEFEEPPAGPLPRWSGLRRLIWNLCTLCEPRKRTVRIPRATLRVATIEGKDAEVALLISYDDDTSGKVLAVRILERYSLYGLDFLRWLIERYRLGGPLLDFDSYCRCRQYPARDPVFGTMEYDKEWDLWRTAFTTEHRAVDLCVDGDVAPDPAIMDFAHAIAQDWPAFEKAVFEFVNDELNRNEDLSRFADEVRGLRIRSIAITDVRSPGHATVSLEKTEGGRPESGYWWCEIEDRRPVRLEFGAMKQPIDLDDWTPPPGTPTPTLSERHWRMIRQPSRPADPSPSDE